MRQQNLLVNLFGRHENPIIDLPIAYLLVSRHLGQSQRTKERVSKSWASPGNTTKEHGTLATYKSKHDGRHNKG